MIELWSEYIEVEIEYTHRARDIVHIGINLVFILDADHFANESGLYRREDIVADIAGQIGELIRIFWINYRPLEIEMIIIVPEIRVLVDVYQLKSWHYDSLSHSF